MIMNPLKKLSIRAKNRLSGKAGNQNNQVIRIVDFKKEDEELENKIRTMLEKDENVLNPLMLLIDEKKYLSLEDEERERYILSIADKYIKIRSKVLNDKYSKS